MVQREGHARGNLQAEHRSYHCLLIRSPLEKAVSWLLGLIEGVAIDGVITPGEEAVRLRKRDVNLFVVHEHAFRDAVHAHVPN